MSAFTQAYKYYGIHLQSDNSVIAREWAPGAAEVYLTGDFSMFYSLEFRIYIQKFQFKFILFNRQLAMARSSIHKTRLWQMGTQITRQRGWYMPH